MLRLRRLMGIILALGALTIGQPSRAQGVSGVDPFTAQEIDRVVVEISNPSADAARNSQVEDAVRKRLGLFPGARFAREQVEFQLAQARRIGGVVAIDYKVAFGLQGGLELIVTVKLADSDVAAGTTGPGSAFPVLYDKAGTYLRVKLDLLTLGYANNNAWYGRPDKLLAGNPLVSGTPAGEGLNVWNESFVHYGIYGITPVNSRTYVYGGASALAATSVGNELFTDDARAFNGIEDAYVGIVGGNTDESGNRLIYNASVGRKSFNLADSFLIANTAGNGGERGALQANARWASDLLVQGAVRYNDTLVELFYLDPDELPVIDSKTTYAGANLQFVPASGLQAGISLVTAPRSQFAYIGPTGTPVGTREGLVVIDARLRYHQNGTGRPGLFLAAEYARQTNRNFAMDARAGWVEAGYSFDQVGWSPTISYRYARFSGDDPDTVTFERWDPMLAGGNGEQWVQGANHFKVVGNSNIVSHRLQGRLRPAATVELVPQLWVFFADSRTNIGGNPALSFLDSDEYGYEANLTAKWFGSRNLYVHGHVAYTWPGSAVRSALDGDTRNWLSAMIFIRQSF